MAKIEDFCIEIYNEFIRATTCGSDYVVVLKNTDYVTLNKFIKHYQEKIGKQSLGLVFIISYVEYQFSYYRDLKTRFTKGTIYFNWIFGKKAISRYDKYHSKIFSRDIRQDIGQKILQKYTQTKRNTDFFLKINEVEEKEKQRYLNKEEGLMWCLQNTSLYNKHSKQCNVCMSSINCREILKLNYPKLYTKRKL